MKIVSFVSILLLGLQCNANIVCEGNAFNDAEWQPVKLSVVISDDEKTLVANGMTYSVNRYSLKDGLRCSPNPGLCRWQIAKAQRSSKRYFAFFIGRPFTTSGSHGLVCSGSLRKI